VVATSPSSLPRELHPFSALFSKHGMTMWHRADAFIRQKVLPAVATYESQYHAAVAATGGNRWVVPSIVGNLKAEARTAGLFNLFLGKKYTRKLIARFGAPPTDAPTLYGAGLTTVEYGAIAELMGTLAAVIALFTCHICVFSCHYCTHTLCCLMEPASPPLSTAQSLS
jgi:hypothetical protein